MLTSELRKTLRCFESFLQACVTDNYHSPERWFPVLVLFSNLANGHMVQVKNVANTGVLQWGGRLLALHESGLPYEMRLGDLSTVGETNLDGAIDREGPFAAHYRIMHQPDGTQRWACAQLAGRSRAISSSPVEIPLLMPTFPCHRPVIHANPSPFVRVTGTIRYHGSHC